MSARPRWTSPALPQRGPVHHRSQGYQQHIQARGSRRKIVGVQIQHDRRHRRRQDSRPSKQKKTTTISASRSEDLSIGRIDAVVVDSPTAAGYVLPESTSTRPNSRSWAYPSPRRLRHRGQEGQQSTASRPHRQGPCRIQKDGTLDTLKKKWLQ